MEPLAAFKGEVEPRFGGFTWLQQKIHQRSYFAKRFLKRLNSTREATPPEKPEPELFLEEPEPYQTGPTTSSRARPQQYQHLPPPRQPTHQETNQCPAARPGRRSSFILSTRRCGKQREPRKTRSFRSFQRRQTTSAKTESKVFLDGLPNV
jgi:hypothetical protein